jgi:hypothetical protein
MEMVEGRDDAAAQLKPLIIHQQKLAAEFARTGKTEKARAARNALLALLNKLDMLREARAS